MKYWQSASSPVYKLGHGCFPMWSKEVDVDKLRFTGPLLIKGGFKEDKVSMEKLICWKSLKGMESIGNVSIWFLENYLLLKFQYSCVLYFNLQCRGQLGRKD